MRTIEVGELEGHAREILRQVEGGETVEVTDGGKAVARLVPILQPKAEQRPYSKEEGEAFITEMHQLAEEIGKYWPEGVSAVDAVRDVRRDL